MHLIALHFAPLRHAKVWALFAEWEFAWFLQRMCTNLSQESLVHNSVLGSDTRPGLAQQ